MSHPQVVGRRLAGWVAGVVVLIAAGVALRQLARLAGGDDLAAVRAFGADRPPVATSAAHGLSILGRSWTLLALAVAGDLIAWRLGRRVLALAAVLAGIAVQNAVKAIVARPRPPLDHLEHVTSSSFPSGHATETTALAVAACQIAWPAVRGRAARAAVIGIAAGTALAVACARVYLSVHYPTDVAAGILLGAGCAAVASRCAAIRSSPSHRGLSP